MWRLRKRIARWAVQSRGFSESGRRVAWFAVGQAGFGIGQCILAVGCSDLAFTLKEMFWLVFLAASCCALWTAALRSGDGALAAAALLPIWITASIVFERPLVSFWTMSFIAFIASASVIVLLAVIASQVANIISH